MNTYRIIDNTWRGKIRSGRTAPGPTGRCETEVVYNGRTEVFANTGFVPISNASAKRNRSLRKGNKSQLLDKRSRNTSQSEILLGKAASSTASVPPTIVALHAAVELQALVLVGKISA